MNRWSLSVAVLLLGLHVVPANSQDNQRPRGADADKAPAARKRALEGSSAEESSHSVPEPRITPMPVKAAAIPLSRDAVADTAPAGARLVMLAPVAMKELPRAAFEPHMAATSNCDDCGFCDYPTGRVWISAEYLLWWTNGDRLPPLLTTSPAGTPLVDAGVLGRPGTSVLFGDDRVNDGVRSGGRFTGGFWLNAAHTTGVEGSYFFLGNQTTNYSIASDGIPILTRPFFDVLANANNSLKIAYPGLVAGSFTARETSEFWGTDVYLRHNICCGCCCRVDLLAGYRFLSLSEGLNIAEVEISTNREDAQFGIPIFINEGFSTRNNFHGGQIGVIAEYAHRHTFVRFVGKLALGGNCRTAALNGTTRANGFAPETGGFLALPSNIGRYDSSAFSVVPEVGITLGYSLTQRMRLMAGYSFLYWTNVARPGEQIELTVNTSQPPLGDRLVGQARPNFSFRGSDFWAQGMSFGVEFRY